VATYIVTKIRKELSSDGTHHHIKGVCTDGGGVPRGLVTNDVTGSSDRCAARPYAQVSTPLRLQTAAAGDRHRIDAEDDSGRIAACRSECLAAASADALTISGEVARYPIATL
jgi:hypothetical protein